ncbi:MAG: hypothetical protein ACRDNJ_01020 [Solirubrobacteraceae bacterium]
MAIAGCGSGGHSATSGAARRASTTSAQGQRAAIAAEFAGAYVRFLDGAGTAAALPDTATSVRALAGQAGPVPVARRRGTLVLVEMRAAQGQQGSYVLAASDAAHTFYATIAVSRQHGRWLVSGLTPPDFVQALAPPGPPAPASGSSAPEHAARAFLDGYLPWLYGQGPLRAIRDATANLVAGLEHRPPRVPLTMRSLHPKLVAIALQRHRGGWQALPNVTDGRETYELVLTITQTRGRWLVSGVSNPR